MSVRLRGLRRGKALRKAVLDLIGEFDEQCTVAGLSARQVDAQVAATLIELLCMIVEQRETFSADGMLAVIKEALEDAEAAYAEDAA